MGSAIQATPAWITGLGAVTSVGLDAATTCASIRAGISRPSELEGHESMGYLDYEPVATTGHAVPELARGFSGVGRWMQLAAAAIEDLCDASRLPAPADDPAFWKATVAYLVLPVIDDERFGLASYCEEEHLPRTLRDPLLARVAERFAPVHTSVLARGRAGVLEVLASLGWQTKGVERVVIVATDSLVDVPSLRWLEETGRLKNDMNPVGLSPAEASVALMLEEPRSAQHRGAAGLAVLHAAATDLDPERSAGKGAGGVGLARAVQGVLERSSLQDHGAASYVGDLNGEVWRARELAAAQMRVGPERWSTERMVLPVVSTGDPGAALPALQIVVATTALQRGYAGGSSVLVTSSEPGGKVGAAIIGRSVRA
ncbi:MAG: hypothetical protein KC501_30950 [Myxococcales bacterium]|nr:hypothetical protein [Myxococcales bacterium]